MTSLEERRRQVKLKRIRAATVNYHKVVSMPIRDMWLDGHIVFIVDIYGWTAKDICIIPDGSKPILAAIKRFGLDPERYQPMIWDAPV